MAQQQDTQEMETPEDASAELARGLQRCHTILDDYRSRIAGTAPQLEPATADNDDTLG